MIQDKKTATSLSGGRTSCYMALHYPTDHNIFSLVRIEDNRCTPKDKKLIQYIEDKIQKGLGLILEGKNSMKWNFKTPISHLEKMG